MISLPNLFCAFCAFLWLVLFNVPDSLDPNRFDVYKFADSEIAQFPAIA